MAFFTQDETALESQRDDAARRIEDLSAKIERFTQVRGLFDAFPSWEQFRNNYLRGVRLAQLHRASASSLGADEATRTRLAGQIAEIEFLCVSRDELDTQIQRMVEQRAEQEKRRTKIVAKLERTKKR